ncbi:MAG: hypothetical protein ABIT07_10490 [Ferruginibacter sp.]
MQDLINQITAKAGINEDQATKAIHAIKDFVKEKFPMMAGAVDNLFAENNTPVGMQPDAPVTMHVNTAAEPSMLDKISDFIPGETGEKVEGFAKTAAQKAEDLYENAKDKLNGMFGNSKDA